MNCYYLSQAAENDIAEILEFIIAENPTAADQLKLSEY